MLLTRVIAEMATDIKDIYPNKHITLVHSRQQLLNRFHPGLHSVAQKQCEALGIELVVGDRAIIPTGGFPVEEGVFEVQLESGRRIIADFAVRTPNVSMGAVTDCALKYLHNYCKQIMSIGQTPQSALISTLSPGAITRTGFIAVQPTLQIADSNVPNVFAVGDIADTGANKAARPGMVQANVVARNIVRLIERQSQNSKGERDGGRESRTESGSGALETYTFDAPAIHLTLGIVSHSCRNNLARRIVL